MKYCSTILVGLLCTAACLAQTPLPESRRTSPEIFIYKPDARELRELHVKGKAPDEGMLHTFVGNILRRERSRSSPGEITCGSGRTGTNSYTAIMSWTISITGSSGTSR